MAVQNRLAKANPTNKVIEYDCNGQMVKLSANTVKNYLVSGNGDVTDQEVAMFINLCKYQKLNPFIREAYLIKFGNQPATIVTGKDAITKRAMRNPRFAGQQAGVVVINSYGELENRIGTIVLKDDELVGGWAKAYVTGYAHPIEVTVSFDEYAGRKADGTLNGQWQKKPATMIRKVALVQALREAFPEDLGGMYASEERGVDDNILSTEVINMEVVEEKPKAEPVAVEVEEVSAEDVSSALFG